MKFTKTMLLFFMITACTNKAYVEPNEPLSPSPSPAAAPIHANSFANWQQLFTQYAIVNGIEANFAANIIANTKFQNHILRLDRKQPEFSKMPWDYLESALTRENVRRGQQYYRQYKNLLDKLQRRYGVAGNYLLAIWALESSYGKNTGNSDILSALATLAYEGRRNQFFSEQLLALLQLIANGEVAAQPKGSWAGGMGHTQFIPTTYRDYAQDGDGDGKTNLWQVADALASSANYLQRSGWRQNAIWGVEVKLPKDFEDKWLGKKLTAQHWQQLGINSYDNAPLKGGTLWLPAGVTGPAFLIYDNFDVIKVYNNSSNYALAIGLLADAIAGGKSLTAKWPKAAQPLSSREVETVQNQLQAQGFYNGKIDGIIGVQTRLAFQNWQRKQKDIFADGFLTQQSAAQLLQ